MKDVFVVSGNAVTSLGFSAAENFERIVKGATGISYCHRQDWSPDPFFASLISSEKINDRFLYGIEKFTRLEKLMILAIEDSVKDAAINFSGKETLLVITTTKGNIDVLDGSSEGSFPASRAYLHELCKTLKNYFQCVNEPLIICNACISGVMGIITGSRYIRSGKYKNVVVCGGDIISPFTVSGFQSFKAFGTSPCRPYDAARDGLSLGEGAGALLLTDNDSGLHKIKILGGAISNDANHISGPSRTGEGLLAAIIKAMDESSLKASDIGYISAHGTATPYNDEMESKAMNSAGLEHVPLNSFKGAIGHTLGAAGVIETVLAAESMKRSILLPSTGYSESGVTQPINVIREAAEYDIQYTLKTASGFGGCNGAVLFSYMHG
jgi:3-oxoacyl-[acyl-carrier-protein] synthase-1